MKHFIFLLCLFLTACQEGRVYEQNQAIPSAQWDAKKVFKFTTDITDTSTNSNVLINLRHTGNYPYSNLYLFLTIYSPSGQEVRDTVQVFMADPTGKWFGTSNLGDIYHLRKMYKKNIRFGQRGTYTFFIGQAMRVQQLPGITDVGIRIEKTKISQPK